MRNNDAVLLENLYTGIKEGDASSDVFEKYAEGGLGQSAEMYIDNLIEQAKSLIESDVEQAKQRLAKRAIINLWLEKIHDWRMEGYRIKQ